MKNKYIIGESIECLKSLTTYIIKDFEYINGFFLYYFIEGSSLPEKNIRISGFSWLKKIITTTEEEKNRQINLVLLTMDEDLNRIMSEY